MNSWVCENCGDEVNHRVGGECVHRCSEVVQKERLRKLVEDLNAKAKTHAKKGRQATTSEGTSYGEGLEHAFEHSADVLEDLIDG